LKVKNIFNFRNYSGSQFQGSRFKVREPCLRQAAIKIKRFSDSSDPPRQRRYWDFATGTRIDSEYEECKTTNRELWTV